MSFFKVCKESVIRVRDLLSNTFEREYSCNKGNPSWKILNREVSEPSGLVGLISDILTPKGARWVDEGLWERGCLMK